MTIDYSWIDTVEVGDVLLERGVSPRVVRKVSKRLDGHVFAIFFTIKNCSWTKRCYTVLNRSDLKTRQFSKSGVRVATDSEMDRKILGDFHKRPEDLSLHCCDVKGVM